MYGEQNVPESRISGKTDTSKGEIQIVLKRYLEKIVLHFYKKSQRHEKKVEK